MGHEANRQPAPQLAAVILTCLLAWAVPAAAQESPPAGQQPPAADQAKPPADKAKPAEGQEKQPAGDQEKQPAAEEKPQPDHPLVVIPGFSDWFLTGNDHKFRQYATPPRGLFLGLLGYQPTLFDMPAFGNLAIKTPGQQDYRLDGRYSWRWGTSQLEAALLRNDFFATTPQIIPDSNRGIGEAYLKQFVNRDFSLSTRFRMDEQNQYFVPPLLPLHQRTRYWDAVAQGRLGPGQIGLLYTDWHYYNRIEHAPDTDVGRWELKYLWAPHPVLGLEGSISRADVKQSDQPTGSVQRLQLLGDVQAGPSTDVNVLLRRDRIDFPQVQNAYEREERIGEVRLVHRFSRWTGQLAVRNREAERIRGDHSFVDVPKWWTFDGRLSGRLGSALRMQLRGWWETLSNAPLMTSVTDDRSLLWSDRSLAQLRIDTGRPEINAYLNWTLRYWNNRPRNTHLTFNGVTVGGTWQARPAVGLFGEFNYETWSGKGETTDFPTFENFLPDSRTIVVGVNWAATPRLMVWANYTDFDTFNDNPLLLPDGNTNGRFLTMNITYLLRGGSQIGLVVAPWDYGDRVESIMNYHSTVVMVTGSGRF